MATIKVVVTEVSETVVEIDTETGISTDGYYFDDVLDAVEEANADAIYASVNCCPPSPDVRSASVYVYESDGSLVMGKVVKVD